MTRVSRNKRFEDTLIFLFCELVEVVVDLIILPIIWNIMEKTSGYFGEKGKKVIKMHRITQKLLNY